MSDSEFTNFLLRKSDRAKKKQEKRSKELADPKLKLCKSIVQIIARKLIIEVQTHLKETLSPKKR